MNDIERALQAAMTTELDGLEMPDRLPYIRQRARRERLFLAAAGGFFLLVTGLVIFWSASALNTSERDKGVVNPAPKPSQEATTFGRFGISFGGGFNRQGEPVEATGIVEIDSKLGTACFEASILGTTSAHLHRDGQTDAVVMFFEPPQRYRPTTCVDQQSPGVLQQIIDDPASYYIEFHGSFSDRTLISDLDPLGEDADSQRAAGYCVGDDYCLSRRKGPSGARIVATAPSSGLGENGVDIVDFKKIIWWWDLPPDKWADTLIKRPPRSAYVLASEHSPSGGAFRAEFRIPESEPGQHDLVAVVYRDGGAMPIAFRFEVVPRNPECPEGIEGKGLERVEPLPTEA